MSYTDEDLREQLSRLGISIGPIVDSTRNLYVKKLNKLKAGPSSVGDDDNDCSCSDTEPKKKPVKTKNTKPMKSAASFFDIAKCLGSDDWMQDLKPFMKLEKEAREYFENPRYKLRSSAVKKSFTYLLLDPRITKNLPARVKKLGSKRQWTTFIDAIFYVGKGKNDRPYKHLIEAIPLWNDEKSTKDMKIQQILDIWEEDMGVICIQVFHNVTSDEALTYEAAMIDALGLETLTNVKAGSYKGIVASWTEEEQLMLGIYLLYKAMKNYLNEGERQLKPDDV